MDSCLLCLEIDKEFGDCIKVDSKQWLEYNIKTIIEKHLWILETLLPSSWICNTCWQALNDFHKFYMRIEDAHTDFGKLMKSESKTFNEESNDLFVNININESYLEPEILMDNLQLDKPNIKKEYVDDDVESLAEDDIPLGQRSKRTRQSKYVFNDPLNSSKKSKKATKCKTKKTETSKHEKSEIVETLALKPDPDAIQMPNTSSYQQHSSDSEDFDSYTDCDYMPKEESKPPKKTTKKTKASRKKLSNSNDSNTDKPDEDDIKPPKITSKERDQFVAENFKITCVLCQIPMVTFKDLLKHFEVEHNERGYAVCCNKKFYHRIMLAEHIERHIDPNNFTCKQCGKELTSRLNLKNHQLTHLPEEEKKFACTECGKTYGEQNKLTNHINQVHLQKDKRICDICGQNLRCGEPFQRHMLKHEGKPLPTITCPICGLVLATKHSLRKHTRHQHPADGKKEFACKICFKISPNVAALGEHMRRLHSGEVYKCTMCERVFKMAIKLKEHMATHTGVALYTCTWCPKTFNACSGLHAHRKRQHPVEWEQAQIEKRLLKYRDPAVLDIHNTTTTNTYN